MKRFAIAALALVGIALAFAAGSWYGKKAARDGSPSGVRKVLYYVDPMNPMNRYDRPGKAPCGMDLEPVYEEEAGAAKAPGGAPGTVHLGTGRQQLIGVRTGPVAKAAGSYTLRAPGRIAPDETRVYPINAPVDGRITRTGNQTRGSSVRMNETLAAYYNPEVIKSGNALLSALNAMERAGKAAGEGSAKDSVQERSAVNIRQQRDALKNLGVGDLQIDEMVRARKLMESIDIVSPVNGFVLARSVSDGQRFEKGAELYRIADLSRVWILADVYENEVRHIRPGMTVRFSLPRQGEEREARVSDVLPQFDPASRTMKVRLEADNRRLELRPDMFVDVLIPVRYPEAVVVSADAVIDSGTRKTVYVDRGNGYFEPRSVETGWRHGDRVEIVRGLAPGERIVLSANFLIDSESKLKASAEGIFGASHVDPVCGMNVDEGRARATGRTVDHGGTTYFFCADACREKFVAEPGRYLKGKARVDAQKPAPSARQASAGTLVREEHGTGRGAQAPATAEGRGAREGRPGHGMPAPEAAPGAEVAIDPVCGMMVATAEARAAGRVSEYRGTTRYFCADSCKAAFDKDPERYPGPQGGSGGHQGTTGRSGAQ
jgi:Cu(I)/Ag(I) efflux system membrane fusion protein